VNLKSLNDVELVTLAKENKQYVTERIWLIACWPLAIAPPLVKKVVTSLPLSLADSEKSVAPKARCVQTNMGRRAVLAVNKAEGMRERQKSKIDCACVVVATK
jgi:hypothetical protein